MNTFIYKNNKTDSLDINYMTSNGPLDPKSFVSTWDDSTFLELNELRLYTGINIYCIEDRINRICKWSPTINSDGAFSAKHCIWDILHTDDDDKNKWLDITNYTIETSIEKKILEAELDLWKYSLSVDNTTAKAKSNYKFIGYMDSSIISSKSDENKALSRSIINVYDNYTNVSKSKLTNSIDFSKEIYTIILSKTEEQLELIKEGMKNTYLVIVCPSYDRESNYVRIDDISFGNNDLKFDSLEKLNLYRITRDLSFINNETYEFELYKYDIYVIKDFLITEDIINTILTDYTAFPIKITFKKTKFS